MVSSRGLGNNARESGSAEIAMALLSVADWEGLCKVHRVCWQQWELEEMKAAWQNGEKFMAPAAQKALKQPDYPALAGVTGLPPGESSSWEPAL